MLKAPVYSLKGVKTGDFALPKEYGEDLNLPLLAQARRVYEDGSHTGLRKAKTRAEVNRTGKKIYKQKGTGGARHGSRRANVFVGGGVAHGPRPIRRVLELSGRMRKMAKAVSLASKAQKGKLVLVKGFEKLGKTKEAGILVKALEKDTKQKRLVFVLSEANAGAKKFLRNLGNAEYTLFRSANAHEILGAGLVVMDEAIFEVKKETKTVKEIKKPKIIKKVTKKTK